MDIYTEWLLEGILGHWQIAGDWMPSLHALQCAVKVMQTLTDS